MRDQRLADLSQRLERLSRRGRFDDSLRGRTDVLAGLDEQAAQRHGADLSDALGCRSDVPLTLWHLRSQLRLAGMGHIQRCLFWGHVATEGREPGYED